MFGNGPALVDAEHTNNASDKKLININFDNEPTVEGSSKKSVSGTSLSNGGLPQIKKYNRAPETSERIDPTKIDLIEDYGSGDAGSRKGRKNKNYCLLSNVISSPNW